MQKHQKMYNTVLSNIAFMIIDCRKTSNRWTYKLPSSTACNEVDEVASMPQYELPTWCQFKVPEIGVIVCKQKRLYKKPDKGFLSEFDPPMMNLRFLFP